MKALLAVLLLGSAAAADRSAPSPSGPAPLPLLQVPQAQLTPGRPAPVAPPRTTPVPGRVPVIATPLMGTTWTLVTLDTGRGPVTLSPAIRRPTLRLQATPGSRSGTATITTPCGAQTTPFTWQGAALTFPRVARGGSQCPDALLSLHEDYLTLLRAASGQLVVGDRLTIRAGPGRLVFQGTPVTSLTPPGAGVPRPTPTPTPVTRELVVNVLSLNGKVIPVPATAKVRLTTTPGGKVTLSASLGCNTLSAEGTLTGNLLRFGPVTATKMMCPDMAAETAFLSLLREPLTVSGPPDAPRWDGPRGQVELTTLAQALTQRAPLSGTYTLTGVNGQAAPTVTRPITMSFEDGRIGGTDGCNSYGGQYTLKGGALIVSELVRTMMICPDMDTANLLPMLEAKPTLTQAGQTLTLSADGQIWVFTRQP